MVIFHSYVKLPEGIIFLWAFPMVDHGLENIIQSTILNHHIHWMWKRNYWTFQMLNAGFADGRLLDCGTGDALGISLRQFWVVTCFYIHRMSHVWWYPPTAIYYLHRSSMYGMFTNMYTQTPEMYVRMAWIVSDTSPSKYGVNKFLWESEPRGCGAAR